jgi:hypothetical protein
MTRSTSRPLKLRHLKVDESNIGTDVRDLGERRASPDVADDVE